MKDGMKKDKKRVDDEAKRIAITAAKLIREEIRTLKLSLDSYPNKDDITDSINWLLETQLAQYTFAPDTIKG